MPTQAAPQQKTQKTGKQKTKNPKVTNKKPEVFLRRRVFCLVFCAGFLCPALLPGTFVPRAFFCECIAQLAPGTFVPRPPGGRQKTQTKNTKNPALYRTPSGRRKNLDSFLCFLFRSFLSILLGAACVGIGAQQPMEALS